MNNNVLTQYEQHLRAERYSPVTTEQYLRVIRNIIDTMGGIHIPNISEKHLQDFRSSLKTEPTSTKTQNLKIIILRSFLSWSNQEGITNIRVKELKTFRDANRRKPFNLISKEELKTFLAPTNDTEEDLLVNTLYATGLRLHELTAIRVGQVSEEFTIVGKGNKSRTVFLPTALVEQIKSFTEQQQYKDNAPVFQMTHRTIQRRIKNRGKKYNLSQEMTPHKLRHLYATHLYENGADLRTLQEILGHSSISTTQVYTHVNTEQMRETVRRCTMALWYNQ